MPGAQPHRVHVIGAGLAGLSASLRLAEAGCKVSLYEGTGHAGGRCRSFFDEALDRQIDNGNHLLFSGNTSARGYLRRIGSIDAFHEPAHATFDFVDLEHDRRYTLSINDGILPLWLLNKSRRLPDAGILDHARAFRLLLAGPDQTVADVIKRRDTVWRGFVEPLTLAAINTTPEQASARLMRRVLMETFVKGGRMCRPMIAKQGLGPALIDPALETLAHLGVDVTFNALVRHFEISDNRVQRLIFSGRDDVSVTDTDSVVVALPPARLAALLPDLKVPKGESAILNAHFRVLPILAHNLPLLLGVLGATTHWIFVRDDVISLTVSASDALGVDALSNDDVTALLWAETVKALNLPPNAHYLAARIIKEKRATFLQTPENVRLRAKARTALKNVFLAGDATDTGLPATIEGSIRSGETVSRLVQECRVS